MEDNGRDMGAFLRARRARVAPESVGIPGGRRRRVRGLRREELAQLAGISVDYYVRLEQGRATQPSAEVLDALARALGLDATERDHLRTLATRRDGEGNVDGGPRPGHVGPAVQRILDGMPMLPAVVMDYRMDVVGWNGLGSELFGRVGERPPAERNHARYVFLDPAAREIFPDWAERTREMVAVLRHATGRHPGDTYLAGLVAELTARDAGFRRFWAAGEVLLCGSGTRRFWHPAVGELILDYETLCLPATAGELDEQMYVYSPAEGSESAGALRLLAERVTGAAAVAHA
ncbi:helix-turn-helix domain-containing protein [Streptomyces litchfieldiae]|uniref:Helix-turn-helix transcriptional regulator n=1 Tax=Streptomyces litchfieldiae TaxID=3075543 RepID=A0ABU2MWG3_9ACTN|nr:helix-turn-helix transcriptional regulator [Streptomyces sp. DSM 44938]MDT0345986.1 helix-turn-helix transcriptional regulator [Streptomyces sp. DSM 44938]